MTLTSTNSSSTLTLASVVRARPRPVLVIVVLAIIQWGADAAIPWAIARAITASVDLLHRSVAAALLLLLLLVVASIAGSIVRYALAARLQLRIAFDLKERLARRAVDPVPPTLAAVSAGELSTSLSDDADSVGGYPNSLARLLGSVCSLAIVASYLLAASIPLGLIVLLGVPLVMVATARTAAPLDARQRDFRQLVGRLGELGMDLADGLRVLRGLGAHRNFEERYRAVSRETLAAGVSVGGTQALLAGAAVLLPSGLLVAVTWVGAHLALSGSLAPGDLVAFYAAAAFLVEPVGSIADFVTSRAEATVGAEHIARVLATGVEHSATAPYGGEHVTGVLETPATGPICAPGEVAAIVIADGRQQSAIAESLAGLRIDLPEWCSSIHGVPSTHLDRVPARRTLLLQSAPPFVFSGSLRDAVDPHGTASDEAVLAALRTADLIELLGRMPEGLASLTGPAGRNLSGGQRQRVVLARSVLADSPYLVLVDPTDALDTATEIEVSRRLLAARRRAATVVISRSPAFLEVADRVFFIDGEAANSVRTGTHANLISGCAGYRDAVDTAGGEPR